MAVEAVSHRGRGRIPCMRRVAIALAIAARPPGGGRGLESHHCPAWNFRREPISRDAPDRRRRPADQHRTPGGRSRRPPGRSGRDGPAAAGPAAAARSRLDPARARGAGPSRGRRGGAGSGHRAVATVSPVRAIQTFLGLGASASQGSSPTASVVKTLTGSASGGGLGPVLPLLLIASLLAAAVLALRRGRRTS